MLNLFKKSNTKKSISNFTTEKLNEKELKQVMGGAVNYNASKSNTGNGTDQGSTGSSAPNVSNQPPAAAVSGGTGN